MNLGRGSSTRSDINVTPLIDVARPPSTPPIVIMVKADLSVTIRRGATEVEIAGTELATTLRPLLER